MSFRDNGRHGVSPNLLARLKRGGLITSAHFVIAAIKNARHLRRVYAAPRNSRLGRLRMVHPALSEMVLAPFMSAQWTAAQRFVAVERHCQIVDTLGEPFAIGVDEYRNLIELEDLLPLTHVTIAMQPWRFREGLVTLGLCTTEGCIFTLSFILADTKQGIVALVGGIQGASLPGIGDVYRQATKTAHGMRPKDLLIEVFRSLCRAAGIDTIKAVSDAARHQRSTYSLRRSNGRDPVELGYDTTWHERGGVLGDDGFFDVPVTADRRTEAEMPANKRSMYRRRYTLLDTIDTKMRTQLPPSNATRP